MIPRYSGTCAEYSQPPRNVTIGCLPDHSDVTIYGKHKSYERIYFTISRSAGFFFVRVRSDSPRTQSVRKRFPRISG